MESILWTYFIVAVIVNAGFSAIVAYVAKQKGRSTSGFFWLSFFLSFLVGILVVLAIPKKEDQLIESKDSKFVTNSTGEQLVKCPFCAEWIKAEAKVCKHCGRDVSGELELLRKKEIEALELNQKLKAEADKAQESAREAQQQQIAEERKQKARKFWSNKPLVIASTAIGLVGIAALVYLIMTSASINQAKQEEQAFSQAERKQAFDDWSVAIDICSQTLGKDVDIQDVKLSEEANEITVSDISGRNEEFSRCLVDLLVPKLADEFAEGTISDGGVTTTANGVNVTVAVEASDKYLGASQLWLMKQW